jgi:DNA (cytosine-5)-methyltransferase 1
MTFNGNKSGLNFIDVFSGCGGFSYGLELAGHRCMMGIDFNEDAIKTFQLNHPHALGLCRDLTSLKSQEIKKLLGTKKVEMIVGGPPCQGFSTVGRGEVGDERNHLFKEFVRLVKDFSPQVVMFENVTGLLAHKNEKTLAAILSSFSKLGYHMNIDVLSADEFKVPSKRRRTFIVGMKNQVFEFPKPLVKNFKDKINVQTLFSVLENKSAPQSLKNHQIDKAQGIPDIDVKRLKYIPPGQGIRYQKDEKKLLPKKLFYEVDWNLLKEGRFRQTRLQRLPLNDVAPTILTSRTSYYHPTEPRYLTAREAALCQSFPLDFEFVGSLTSSFRQIGNAVPPQLAKVLGQHLLKQLKSPKQVPESFLKKKTQAQQDWVKEKRTKAFSYADVVQD